MADFILKKWRPLFSGRLLASTFIFLLGFLLLWSLIPSSSRSGDLAVSPSAKVKSQTAAGGLINLLLPARSAYAAVSAGEGDTVADLVYGQDDLITGTAPAVISSTTLFEANDIYVHPETGQIFIADTAHNRVLGWASVDDYEIGDPADIVLGQPDFETAAAPSPPSATSMNHPQAITMGFDGVLYVSDTGNNRVLVFIPWNICDFYEYYDEIWCKESEGYTFSEHFAPHFTSGMAADYALGQADLTTGAAQGTAASTLNAPIGLVTDINDNLVVADSGNNRVIIHEWPITTGSDATWVVGQTLVENSNAAFTSSDAPHPPTATSMNAPSGVAVGTLANELYVADTGNNRILVFTDDPIDNTADEVIGQSTFVTNTANSGGVLNTTLNAPTGLKMDAGNRLFVADTGNHRVLAFDRVNGDGTADSLFGQPDYTSNTPNNGGIGGSSLYSPTGVATDAYWMDMYIADSGNNRALHFYQPLDNPAPLIAELDPGTVRVGSDAFTLDIWGSGIISDTVIAINGVERAREGYFLGVIEVGITAADIATTGPVTITLTNPAPGGGTDQFVLDVIEITSGDDEGDSILGQAGYTTDNGAFAKMGASTLFGPSGVVVDDSGRVFVADSENGRVLSWSSSNAWQDGQGADLVIGEPDFTSRSLDYSPVNSLAVPVGLALDVDGNLYVADGQWNRVQIYKAPFSNGMAPSLTITGLFNPLDLIVNDAGDLYVADTFDHRVVLYYTPLASGNVDPDVVFGQTNFTNVSANQGGTPTADTLNYPSSVALDAAGNLYVSDSANNRILLYMAGASDGDTTADVVFGQGGSFTSGTANNGGVSANSLNYPYGLGLDLFDRLYVADTDNNRVLRYDNPLAEQTADAVYGQNGSFVAGRANQATAPNQATLNGPIDVGVTAQGDIYIADNKNNRVIGFRTGASTIYLPMITK